MRKMSWGCAIIGIISITLSIIGVFLPLDGFKGYNLPFQFLIISLQCVTIAIPKIGSFIDIIRTPFFDYIFSIVLITSGIGAMLVKPWGRTLAYVYAISIIFLLMIGIIFFLPGYTIMYIDVSDQGTLSLLPIFIGGGAYILTFLAALLYPVILLIFFSRPRIKEMFGSKI